jgi:hypothetical protein
VNNELEGMWKEMVMAKLLYYAGIYWEELRKLDIHDSMQHDTILIK